MQLFSKRILIPLEVEKQQNGKDEYLFNDIPIHVKGDASIFIHDGYI
jgi:hypothetical protein